jgi:Hus1-like protein
MEVATEPLYQALRSAQSSPDVIIKLAKKDDHAVLNFDVQAVVSSCGDSICNGGDHAFSVLRVNKARLYKLRTM